MVIHEVLLLTRSIVAVGIVISSLEVLFSWRFYQRGELFHFAIPVMRSGASGVPRWVLDGASIVYWAAATRLFCAFTLLLPRVPPFVRGMCALVVLISMAIQTAAARRGDDGADQMAKIVVAAVAGAYLLPSSTTAAVVAACFIAAQAVLAYFCSGVIKCTSAEWRSGRALATIMSMRLFGPLQIGRWLRAHRAWSRTLSWALIAWECLFPLVLLAPPRAVALLIGIGILFHVAAALIMGLNTFLWSFTGTYPCIVFVNSLLHSRSSIVQALSGA
jgi:hypothetical protein